MSSTIMEEELRRALDGDSEVADRGWRILAGPSGGIILERGGAERGHWRWRNGLFELESASGATIAGVETVAEALSVTRRWDGEPAS